MKALTALLLALAPAVAGCAAPALETATAPTPVVAAPESAVTVLQWDGYAVAGAAGEGPSHFSSTESGSAALWKMGFNLRLEELPTALELRLDWTAASPTQMMMMAHVPYNPDDHRDWVEYENPTDALTAPQWPTEGPLCMRIDTTELVPGDWHVMAHSRYGVDIRTTFTVTAVGGKVSIPTGLHGHALDAQEIRELAGVREDVRPWLPCELSGDAGDAHGAA